MNTVLVQSFSDRRHMNKDFHSFSDCHDSDASLPYIYIMIAKLPFMFIKSTKVAVFNQSLIHIIFKVFGAL